MSRRGELNDSPAEDALHDLAEHMERCPGCRAGRLAHCAIGVQLDEAFWRAMDYTAPRLSTMLRDVIGGGHGAPTS